MESGEKPPFPPIHSTSSPSSSSSSTTTSALIETIQSPFGETLGFLLPSSSSPLAPKIEHMEGIPNISPEFRDKLSAFPPSSEVGEGFSVPRPLEALQSTPIPPFLSKTYDLVDDPLLDAVISWSPSGESFVVWDPVEFSRAVLPRHFKHNNFSSFVRQLNTYIAAEEICVELQLFINLEVVSAIEIRLSLGFHKIGTDRWEFANEDFLRGKKSLLKNINRRRSSQSQQIGFHVGSSVEMGKSGIEDEVHKLRKEKDTLMQEVLQLRQDHLMTVKQMDALNQRMQSAEVRQKQMVSFLAKVLQNPVFLDHLNQLKEQRAVAATRVRRKFLKQKQHPGPSGSGKSMDQQIVKYRSDISDVSTSASLLCGIEHVEGKQVSGHLHDMVEKLDVDTCREAFLGGSDEPEALKGMNLLCSQMDVSLTGTDCLLSPEKVVYSDIPSACENIRKPDLEAFSFKGKDLLKFEMDAATTGTEYFASFPEDVSQENIFPHTMAPASDCVMEEGFWNIGLEAGGSSFSSCHDVWSNVAQEMEAEAGSSSFWDLGLNTLVEDLDTNKYVGGESSSEHTDDA